MGRHVGVPKGGAAAGVSSSHVIHVSEKTTQGQKVVDKQAARKAKLLEQRNAIGLFIRKKV